MTTIKLATLSAALLLTGQGISISAAEMDFSYTYGDHNYQKVGTKKTETYDVAIRLTDPSLVGTKITSFNVPIVDNEDGNISNVSVWASKELVIENKVNIPDVMSIDAEIIDGEINVNFPDAIDIPEGGLYVGYTFTVNKKGGAADLPVFIAGEANPEGLYMHTSRTYLKWKSQSENFGHSSAITVGLEGDFYANALGITSLQKPYASCNLEMDLKATITSHGSEPLSDFEYVISDGSNSETNTYKFEEPLDMSFGQSFTADLPYVAPAETGDYTLTVEITKVNGNDNHDTAKKIETLLEVFTVLPVHRPLMEEYTGLWCGWCPRGFAALEAMNSLYPEEFVAISYHNKDEMERLSVSQYPSRVDGFPAAYMDRAASIDAYSGIVNDGFGIDAYWHTIKDEFVPMIVEGSAEELTDGSIVVKSEISFVKPTSGRYKVAYAIIANGLSNEAWGQSNNYSGQNPDLYIPEMNKFCKGANVVYGLTFDDIFAAGSNLYGEESSLIENIEPNNVYSHEYTFASNAGMSLRNYNLFSNAKTLDAVIILLDESGIVANCNKILVQNHSSGVESIQTDDKVISTDFYDISGRKVSNPNKGMFIKVETKSNGAKEASKIIK